MKSSWSKTIGLAFHSVISYVRLVLTNSLHLHSDRLDRTYAVAEKGTYAIFRETVSSQRIDENPVVLIVGFRLKLIGSNPFFYWLFQRICIVTTPFWSGFYGFRIKLWMVDTKTKNYLGIYQWEGRNNALTYVQALIRVLTPLSTKGSVWYELYSDRDFEAYLQRIALTPKKKNHHR